LRAKRWRPGWHFGPATRASGQHARPHFTQPGHPSIEPMDGKPLTRRYLDDTYVTRQSSSENPACAKPLSVVAISLMRRDCITSMLMQSVMLQFLSRNR
jgi:hypothetical protein